MKQIFNDKNDLSLIAIKRGTSIDVAEALVFKMITKIAAAFNTQFNEVQMELLIEMFIEDYYFWTLSEFNLLIKFMRTKKLYRGLDFNELNILVVEFNEYRMEIASMQSDNDNKDLIIKTEDVADMPQELKDLIKNIARKSTREEMHEANLKQFENKYKKR